MNKAVKVILLVSAVFYPLLTYGQNDNESLLKAIGKTPEESRGASVQAGPSADNVDYFGKKALKIECRTDLEVFAAHLKGLEEKKLYNGLDQDSYLTWLKKEKEFKERFLNKYAEFTGVTFYMNDAFYSLDMITVSLKAISDNSRSREVAKSVDYELLALKSEITILRERLNIDHYINRSQIDVTKALNALSIE